MKAIVKGSFKTTFEHLYLEPIIGTVLDSPFADHCVAAGFPVEIIEGEAAPVVSEPVGEAPIEQQTPIESTPEPAPITPEPTPEPVIEAPAADVVVSEPVVEAPADPNAQVAE